MILDEIIAVIFSFFGLILEGVSAVFVLFINIIAMLIEKLIGLFISGFKVGRVKRYKKAAKHTKKENSLTSLFVFVVLVAGLFAFNFVMNKEITFIATDGHTLPFAAVIVHSDGEQKYLRTDNSGHITISRFGVDKIEIKDKRYIKKIWVGSEIGSIMEVDRTLFGSSLDKITDKLFRSKN